MATKQLIAIFGALAFLGTFAVLAATLAAIVAAKVIGEERLSRWTAATSNWIFGGWGLARKLASCGARSRCGLRDCAADGFGHKPRMVARAR